MSTVPPHELHTEGFLRKGPLAGDEARYRDKPGTAMWNGEEWVTLPLSEADSQKITAWWIRRR